MEDHWQILLGFGILALASHQIGRFLVRVKLPLISGFLFAGMIVGPFGLGMLSGDAVAQLRFIDEASLAVIAFAAGNELYLKELRSRLKSIAWVTIGLVVATFTLGSLAVFLLSDWVPFLRALPSAGRVAVALMAGAILVARSPSSAIAVVHELRAKGPFTQTVLGVTVLMDALVIVIFAINTEIAGTLLTTLTFHVGFVGLVALELALSLAFGVTLAKMMQAVLSLRMRGRFKAPLIVFLGYCVFRLTATVREISAEHGSFEILLEPLLICMIASFVLSNWSGHRNELSDILQRIGMPVYVVFFTLTGASLALDVLSAVWPAALTLFCVRLFGMFLGSFTGGVLAGDPMSHNRISWMGFVTQAGVGLGLAKEVAVEFPEFGNGVATLLIAVIVLNQLVGPPCFKFAIKHLGESHVRAVGHEFDGVRDVVIFGLNARAIALARQLVAHGWQVKIATQTPPGDDVGSSDLRICHVDNWGLDDLRKLDLDRAEGIVGLLSDDDQNHRICELVYEHFGVETMVVRLEQRENRARFRELGVLCVEPETAFVMLLDHLVRSPAGTSLLLGMEEQQEIVDVELRNPNLHRIALRDLRLPLDVLILSIHRRGQTLLSRGHTQLRLGDRVTMVGPEEHLHEVMLRFEA